MNLFKSLISLFSPLLRDLMKVEQLILADKPTAALAQLEKRTALQEQDYASRPHLHSKLAPWLARNAQTNAALYIVALAGVLGTLRRHPHSLLVLEIYLGLEPHHYETLEGLATQLEQRLGHLPPDLRFQILWTLVGVFGVLGRESEGLALIYYDLGLNDEPYEQVDLATQQTRHLEFFTHRVRQRFSELTPDSVALYSNFLVLSLDELGIGNAGIGAIEQALGLDDASYGSQGQLDQKLKAWYSRLQSPLAGIFSLMTLAGALEQAGRPDKSLAILEWCFQIEPADYADVAQLARKWHKAQGNLPVDSRATFWRMLVSVLASAGRNPRYDALAIIEADSGLRRKDDQDPAQIALKMRQRLQHLQIDTQSAYIFNLIDELSSLEEHDLAIAIADWYIRDYNNLWNIPETRDPGITHVIPILVFWLRNQAAVDRAFTWQVCQQSVLYLRQGLNEQGVLLADRKKFIDYVNDLRRALLVAGYATILEATDPVQAKALRLRVHLWDMELTQRVLLERFLLERVASSPATIAPARDNWPFFEEPPSLVDYPSLFGINGDNRAAENVPAAILETDTLACDDRKMSSRTAAKKGDNLSAAYPELYVQARQLSQSGITTPLLAEALGQNSIFIRATFDAEGRLLWTALSSDGGRVWISASGTGQPNDLARLREATAKHDFRLRVGWLRSSLVLRQELKKQIQHVLDVLQPDQRLSAEHLINQLNDVHLTLLQLNMGPVYSLWLLCCGKLWNPPKTVADYDQWADTEVDRLRIWLGYIDDMGQKSSGTEQSRLRDQITQDYIHEVAAIWNVDPLREILTVNVDLVLQVDDALHAVPLAYLPVGGRPLYQQVRSLRSTYSVLLQILQQEAAQDFQRADQATERMLVVSWFDAEDHARNGVKRLHQGHFHLAKQFGLEYYGAADNPESTIGVITAALEKYLAFRVVTICGHGHEREAGVKLRNADLWQGNGCDLSQVELLILVSCSIGRTSQSGDLDVEGFCVQLAIHRALSVIACRWPISSQESSAFANEIVHQYLLLRNQAPEPNVHTGCLRARALNAARKVFGGNDQNLAAQAQTGLNTIAAFELYGLG